MKVANKKYYIIAGEASGDLHGSNLIRAIYAKDATATIRCWGGDLMLAAGGTLVKNYKDLAFMGFAEVVTNLRTILGNMKFCKQDIEQFQPDVIVMIDFPGFNLPIANWAHPKGYKIVWYISPQIWAWKEKRIHEIKKSVDKMLVILPFEKAYYAKWNYKVEYVGHPLIEVIEKFKKQPLAISNKLLANQQIVALLPGSRKQEILKKLPIMLSMARRFPTYHFVVAKAPGVADDFYAPMLALYPNVSAVANQTYSLLQKATAALVTSGTATLETALFGVPQVVCYKANAISYEIAKRVIKIKYISLVNLIMDKLVVKELIQHELSETKLALALKEILEDKKNITRIKNDYHDLWDLLAAGGHASEQAAKFVVGSV
jgi:lipid-A-disaccharide synthase